MMMTRPSPGSRSLATHSRKGRGSIGQPSPLAGEGAASAAGEGRALKLAKRLRSTMTEAETKLWQQLRAKRFEDFKFRRQVPIGPYIADFVCFARRLVVEVDRSQHDGSAHDARRDAWMAAQGFRVLRFWNNSVLTAMDGTLLAIHDALNEAPLPAAPRPPSPARGGGRKDMP